MAISARPQETKGTKETGDGTTQPFFVEIRQMFAKTALVAAALATATAALPVTSAHAGTDIDFSITIGTPNGSISFGNGGGYQPYKMSCWEARNYLDSHFKKVQKVECGGKIYTFEVKNFGPWKKVKLNSWNGQYWFV
jgi:hypothetical protein